MNPFIRQFGVQFMPGRLVERNPIYSPDLILAEPTPAAKEFNVMFKNFNYGGVVTMPGVVGLSYHPDSGYNIIPLFTSPSAGSWNELQTTNFIDSIPTLNTATGEQEKAMPTIVALSRKINNREQKIIISGDADCLSNGELSAGRKNIEAANSDLINGIFYWMSDNEVPIDVSRPPLPDNHFNVTLAGFAAAKVFFIWILPAILAIFGIMIWVFRKRR